MKRLLILLAGLTVMLAIAAGTAAAGDPAFTLTLAADPPAVIVGEPTNLHGTLSAVPDTTSVADYDVTLGFYDDAGCSTEPYDVWDGPSTEADGTYGGDLTLDVAGTYYLATSAAGVTSNCVTLEVAPAGVETIVPAVPSDTIASSYLCWNREMVNPVAYIDKVADEMWATGKYLEPQALLGNVEGGTNIGAYHLVCNAPATTKMTGLGLGGSGEVYSQEQMAAYNAGHFGGNDLDVYHIWK